MNDALLVVVTAYEPPHPFLTIHGWVYVDARDSAAAAAFVQDKVLHDELGSELPATRVRTVIARGNPARVLVETSRRADLLVVGRRSNRFPHGVNFSIGKGCASRAACPVVIVRDDLLDRDLSEAMTLYALASAEESHIEEGHCERATEHSHRNRRHRQFEIRHWR